MYVQINISNKTDRHDISDILLKVALNTINLNPEKKVLVNQLVLHKNLMIIMSVF
jgi:hypothetical protein